jgi:hypothetical protein
MSSQNNHRIRRIPTGYRGLGINYSAARSRIGIIKGYLRLEVIYPLAEARYHLGMLLVEAAYRFAVFRVNARYSLHARFIRLRMRLCKTRTICLERGYLAPDKGNLASHLRYGRAVLNHPVQIINVFLERSHKV